MVEFNINAAVDKEFQAKSFRDIAAASVSALEGIGPVGEGIFEDGLTTRNTVRTVRDLGTWHYYRLARALVDLRGTEQLGKREEHCEQSLRGALTKPWAGKSLEDICSGPLSALHGLSTRADERFANAPLHITSIEKLAECKFCHWAAAICTIADLAEGDDILVKAISALEVAKAEAKMAKEAQLKAEQVAEAAKAAMAKALHRATEAEKARALTEQEVKAEEKEAQARVTLVEKALEEAMTKLKEAEAAKELAEKQHKEEQQKRCEEQRRAALEAQERKGKELEERFQTLFRKIDFNGDGFLSHAELKRYVASVDAAARLKLGIGRWQDFLAEADVDGDGRVSEAEFVEHFTRANLDPVKCYGALFDAIDCYGNGFITRGELREYQWYKNPGLFRILGVSSWDDFVQAVDTDGDGMIQRDEFISHYMGLQAPPQVLTFSDETTTEPAKKRPRT